MAVFQNFIFLSDIFRKWINNYTTKPTFPSMILPEFICFNSNIKGDSKTVHFSFFYAKNLNFIGQLFNDNGNASPWEELKIEFHLKDIQKIYWLLMMLCQNCGKILFWKIKGIEKI